MYVVCVCSDLKLLTVFVFWGFDSSLCVSFFFAFYFLYIDVSMVFITIMIAKIYFPESLKRGQVHEGSSPRPFSYRRKHRYRDSTDDENKKDNDDDDDSFFSSEDLEDELEALYSDEDEEDLLKESVDGTNSSMPLEETTLDQDHFLDTSGPSLFEFDQEQTSRSHVIKRLLFCSLMLNITFVSWGALQERMLTRRYPRYTGDYFTYSYLLVFSNRLWTLVMSGILLLWLKPRASKTTILYEYSFPSISIRGVMMVTF